MPSPAPPNYLASGGFLQQSPNYLQSANGLFNAVVLPNGTFAVFRGPGPGAGPMGNSAVLWATGDLSAGAPGQYYLNMQADGNLVVYQGTPPPNNNTTHIFASNTSNPPVPQYPPYYLVLNDDGSLAVMCGLSPAVTSNLQVWAPSGNPSDSLKSFTATSLVYQTGSYQDNEPILAFSTHYANGTGVPQNILFTYTALLQTVSSWQLTTGVSIQVTTGIEVTTPVLVKGILQVQVALKVDFQIGRSVTTSTSKTVQVPLTVPANTKIKAEFVIANANITVPYTLVGQAMLNSGASFPVTYQGTYVGVQDYNVDGKVSSEPYTGPTHFPLDGSVIVNPYGSHPIPAKAGS